MNAPSYPIPSRLNLAIAALQLALLLVLLRAAAFYSGWALAGLCLAYAFLMNSGYAMLHEAEHNTLHENPIVNDAVGSVLALFFPAPFHLIRQGHLGHHMRNRSDDEAFDYYFEGENPVWKHLQLYGTLTGLFWLVIFFSNILALISPRMLKPKYGAFDRPTQALLESLNPRYLRFIRLEAFAIFLLHGSVLYFWKVPPQRWALLLFSFGFLWSALQYAHHYGTVRDVRKGAMNLRSLGPIDWLLLNHNWHLNHHMNPTVPWLYLRGLYAGPDFEPRGGLLSAYFRMWRGPSFTTDRVQNLYAGRVIR
ncbi:MAG: fatty acid desaturase [Elusimicrobia bacterium]|nr:fatty acid desaturase [Elusimicrobiota bacterium]